MLATLIGAFCLAIFLIWSYKKIDHFSKRRLKYLTYILFGFYLIISTTIMLNFTSLPTTDSRAVANAALDIVNCNIDNVDTTYGYFSRYSNNNSLLLFLIYFFKVLSKLDITDYYLSMNILSLLGFFSFEIFSYLAVRKLKGEIFAAKYLFTSVLHPVMYLTIPWFYTIPICMPFMGLVFYFGVRIFKSNSLVDTCLSSIMFGLFTVVGYTIRPVVAFLSIAFIVCGALWLSKDKRKIIKSILSASLCLIVSLSAYLVIDNASMRYAPSKEHNFPVTHWLMMGLSDYGTYKHEDCNLTYSFRTKEEKVKANVNEIKKRLKIMGALGLVTHIAKKQIYTWSYGSAGYTERTQSIKEHTAIHSYVAGERAEFLHLYNQIFRTAILLLTLFYLIKCFRKKELNRNFLMVVFLFGAFIFYIIWEGKNSYSIPFLFALIFLSTQGTLDIQSVLNKKTRTSYLKKCFIGVLILVPILMIGLAEPFAIRQREIKDFGIYTGQVDFSSNVRISKEKSNLTQRFKVKKDFNSISLKAEKLDGKSKYKIILKDESEKTIFTDTISKEKVKDSSVELKFEKQKINQNENYELNIEPIHEYNGQKENDSINWGTSHEILGEFYEGQLWENNEEKDFLLSMNVYNSSQEPLFNIWIYLLICILIYSLIWLNFCKFKLMF